MPLLPRAWLFGGGVVRAERGGVVVSAPVCAWCGSGFGSRYHEACCERVGALPLMVTEPDPVVPAWVRALAVMVPCPECGARGGELCRVDCTAEASLVASLEDGGA